MREIKSSLIIVITFSILFIPTVTFAQWTQTSAPERASTFCLVSNGMTIFAGSTDGISRSTDNGHTWVTSLTHTDVWSLETLDATIFAGTAKGVYRSNDDGLNWETTDQTLDNMGIESLHFNGNHLYAGTSGSGIYRSSNGGSEWFSANSGITDNYIFKVTSNGPHLYAGTAGGVFTTKDNDIIWQKISSGFNPHVRALVLNNDQIFAGGGSGVFRSTDSGASWHNVLADEFIVNFLLYDSNIFASGWNGVFLSTDNGSTWSNISHGLPLNAEVFSLLVYGTTMYAGVIHNGVWQRSLDEIITSVHSVMTRSVPCEFVLGQNFPNPFNPRTRIVFSLPKKSFVTLTVFDVRGRKIQTLVSDELPAGSFCYDWDGTKLPSGLYIYQVKSDFYVGKRKMILQR